MNRFCATEIWGKSWYCGLTPAYKLFFKYLCDNCNNAGIWDVNWPMVKFHTWESNPMDPLTFGNREEDGKPRVIALSESKWFIRTFVLYQQKIKALSDLNPDNGAHKQIINILTKENIIDVNLCEIYEMPPLMPHQRGLGIGNGIGKGLGFGKKKQPNKEKAFVRDNPPTVEEVMAYCIERNNKINAQDFWDKNHSIGWIDKHGNPYKDWKAVIRLWESWNKATKPVTAQSGPSKRPIAIVVIEKIAAGKTNHEILHDLVGTYSEHEINESLMSARGQKK